MTEAEIEELFNRARSWPADQRAQAADLLRKLELGEDAAYEVFPEQREGIEAGCADARAGRFASDTAVADALPRRGYAVRHTERSLSALHEIRSFVESPINWLIVPGMLHGAIVQLSVDPWMMGVATTIEGVRCHVVPLIYYAIYYEIGGHESGDVTVTILDIANGPRLVWAPPKAA